MPRFCKGLLRFIPVLAGILAVAGAVAFFGAAALAAERPRIGITLPSFRESRWQYDIQALEEQAGSNGVDILVRFAGNDQKQQNIQVKELVNLGIDLLLVTPSDVFDTADGLDYAKSRGIPVISYDRLVADYPVDAYVTFEDFSVGEMMGRFLAEAAPKGKYILLYGPKSDTNALHFFSGAMKYLTPLIAKGDITVLLEAEVAGWRPDVAERLVEQVLETTTDIAAVLAPNDDTAGGVIAALSRYDLAGKVFVTGQDATQGAPDRQQNGTQSMTVFKDTGQLAQKTMQVALGMIGKNPLPTNDVVNNGKVDVPAYFLPVTFLDASGLTWFLRSIEF